MDEHTAKGLRQGATVGAVIALIAFLAIWGIYSCRPQKEVQTRPDTPVVQPAAPSPVRPAPIFPPSPPSVPLPGAESPTAASPYVSAAPKQVPHPAVRCYLLSVTPQSATLKPIKCPSTN